MAKQVNTKAEIRGYLIVMLMLIYLVVIKILKRDKNKGVKKTIGICRSESPVQLGEWLEIRVSRTGRLASLEVENEPAQEILAPGAFTQLSLPLNLYLGGAPSPEMFTPKMKTAASFVGCIQTVVLNHREVFLIL